MRVWPVIRTYAREGLQQEAWLNSNEAIRVYRQIVMCGPNSLYMLLALNDIQVDHSVIENCIPSRREGMSLLELKEAAKALGLRAEVRHCSIEELRRTMKNPVIARMNWQNRSHYVVVIDVTEESVEVLDGTTGERNTFPIQWLNKFWSGYVLMPAVDSLGMWWFVSCMLLILFLLGLLAVKVSP